MALPYTPLLAASAAAGDVDGDGDGDADVLSGNAYDGEFFPEEQDNQLLLNDGSGSFVDATHQLPAAVGDDRGLVREVRLVDLTGDGRPEALVSCSSDFDGGGAGTHVWTNDGFGVFAETQVAAHGPSTSEAETADVDGDGDLDLVTSSYPFLFALWTNDGAASFAQEDDVLPSEGALGEPTFLEVADFDGDGVADAAGGYVAYGGAPDPPELFVWKGDGAGAFAPLANGPAAFLQPHRAVDVDGDGDLDLLGAASLLSNDGAGRFRAEPLAHPGAVEGEVVHVLDVDGDADVDALLTGSPARVWANVTRHVAWARFPAVGSDLLLDVFGPPEEPWVLLGATALLPSPLPLPGGSLQIDPTALVATAVGTANESGRARATFPVPSSPGLAGLSLWWQAAVGTDLRWTNAEETELTLH